MSEKEELAQEKLNLEDALKHKPVRDVFWKLFEDCNLFGKFQGNDTNAMFRWNGERNSAVEVLDEIMEADPEIFILMLRENWKQEEKEKANE